MDSTPLTAQQRRRAEHIAPARSADDRTVLVGMKRRATPAELRAFVDREQARSGPDAGRRPRRERVGGVFEPLKAIDALNENDVDYVVGGGWGPYNMAPLASPKTSTSVRS